jgi:ABC-type nitrate/sulfonate/bicarbonate transport system substrate-binding protein
MMSRNRWWLAIVAFTLLMAACAGGTGDTTTTEGATATTEAATTTTESSTATTEAATTTTEDDGVPEGNLSFKMGHVSTGSIYDQIPVITNERLNAQGWEVEDVYFARTELTPQALAQNNIQIAIELYLEPLRTIAAGGDDPKIQFVMENNGSEFVIVTRSELPTCNDLEGRRFGIHGEASTVSIAAVDFLTNECGITPEVLVIPGGENRIVALENDELDATIVQLGDFLALEAIAEPGKYVIMDSGDAMTVTSGAGYFVNTDWLAENREVAVAYIGELLRTYQLIHDDPSILADAVRANVDVPEETIEEAVTLYLDPTVVNLAPENGGSPDAVQRTIDYFTPEELDEGMDVNNFYDPALVEEAIAWLAANP